jgi:hypothetical protein
LGTRPSPKDLCALVTLTDGKTFRSQPYGTLTAYLNPLGPSGEYERTIDSVPPPQV